MREILIKRNPPEVAADAARRFAAAANETIATRGRFSVALSGGSTPRLLYSLLSSEYADRIDWTSIRFYFGDERNVPPDAPESNYRMARETLFDPLGINEEHVVRWRTELGNPSEAADEYLGHLERNGPFDLVLLGLGGDGHTASLFPRTAALNETEKLAVANWVDELNDFRLTVTFPAINSAANVMFLVAGREKAEAVNAVLLGETQPALYPAQSVKPSSGTLCWVLDRDAARGLG